MDDTALYSWRTYDVRLERQSRTRQHAPVAVRVPVFDMPDEIADHLDLIRFVFRNLNASEFIFDEYHQLEAIEPV